MFTMWLLTSFIKFRLPILLDVIVLKSKSNSFFESEYKSFAIEEFTIFLAKWTLILSGYFLNEFNWLTMNVYDSNSSLLRVPCLWCNSSNTLSKWSLIRKSFPLCFIYCSQKHTRMSMSSWVSLFFKLSI